MSISQPGIKAEYWYQLPLEQGSLRYVAIYFGIQTIVLGVFILAFQIGWGFELPSRLTFYFIPAQILLTLITVRGIFTFKLIKSWHYLAWLLMSVVMLAWFLHDSGGHTNPLISLLLVPLAMSAAMLPWQASFLLAMLTITLYAGLMNFYLPLSGEVMVHHHGPSNGDQMMQLHL